MAKKFDYEKSIARLQEIVELLENGELPLDESIKLFEEGTKLSAECYKQLSRAEQKITQITEIEKTEEGKK